MVRYSLELLVGWKLRKTIAADLRTILHRSHRR
jgi:hypothetical protein